MHLHILGICGTFMGGIAAIARAAGHRVTGSDRDVYPPMSTQLRSLGIEIVVLPWVPATAITQRSDNTFSASHCGPDASFAPRSSNASINGLPRVITLPITKTSASFATPSSWRASKPCVSSMPSAASCVLIGG